ncbi:hypothetical protein RCO27_17340 [Sphingosinicella sp. LHD-64]|uniref:hypothetical protein n=1 Tax=Sphingosinicella sp. LHD-64 TaxID=3072139 RepID=UPI00280CD169|nr:hypothetical protein [Sphingosinicella sp. LHD-64]MDQ8757993.1 hypothetical protein [Sphingosinicella sp. LHD-64]
MPSLLRATKVAAAAPNSRIIGGAGTGVPPVDVEPCPPLELDVDEEVELLVLELVELEVDELVLELVLDEVDTLPLDVEVELEVETLPLDVDTLPLEVDTFPLDVDTFPLDVEMLPLDVEVELPPLDVEVELPPEEVEVDPVELLVEEMTILPPEALLPPKKPPEKKPPPQPPPKPPEPPITTGTPPPPLATAIGGGGGGGTNIGGMIVRVVTVPGAGAAQATRRTVRRITRRSCAARRTCAGRFESLRTAGRAGGFSATWTAPPPTIAPPTVHAQSFAKAIRTDIPASRFWPVDEGPKFCPGTRQPAWPWTEQMQTGGAGASALTLSDPRIGVRHGLPSQSCTACRAG